MSPSTLLPPPFATQHREKISHYTLLCLPPPPAPLSQAALKRAYHRALLRYHPDKLQSLTATPLSTSTGENAGKPGRTGGRGEDGNGEVSVDDITTAYKTLQSPALRDEYNRELLLSASSATAAGGNGGGYAPVGVMVQWDLDDMMEVEAKPGEEKNGGVWQRRCRCGEMVRVHEDLLEEGGDTGEAWVVCEGCSIVYCVAFEVMEE